MTSQQKRIVGVLVIANGAIVLTLILFVTRFAGVTLPRLLPTPVPTYPSGAVSTRECQQRAVQMVSQAGLGGTARVIPGGSLQLDLVYPVAPGEGLDNALQQVWTALDIAIALTEDRCNIVSRVEVQIEPQPPSAHDLIQIRASVDVVDLKAFHNGVLSESEFIHRVQYEVNVTDPQ